MSAISINTYLECVNAFHRWASTEGHLTGEKVHIPRLKQEQKVLATLSPEHVQRIVGFKGRAGSERRMLGSLRRYFQVLTPGGIGRGCTVPVSPSYRP